MQPTTIKFTDIEKTSQKKPGTMPPAKVSEVSLSAYLNCAYQRLFLIEGERYRVQVEIDCIPPMETESNEAVSNASKKLYLSAIIGSIEQEKQAIQKSIQEAVSAASGTNANVSGK